MPELEPVTMAEKTLLHNRQHLQLFSPENNPILIMVHRLD